MQHSKIWLKAGKEKAVKRFHPWIFSGAIARKEPEYLADGEVVSVFTHQGKPLATGHYFNGSIAVRILDFAADTPINEDFWTEKLQKALAMRQQLHLKPGNTVTNVFRLIHGEGDGLPGLIIDYYNGTAVVQAHTEGVFQNLASIAASLHKTLGTHVKCVYSKSGNTLKTENADGLLWGEDLQNTIVNENNLKFLVDWQQGQKTGFFIDQRENRALLKNLCMNKTVLNTFCYTGGFSVYALAGGAKSVTSVDISENATRMTEENARINGFDGTNHHVLTQDVMHMLKSHDNQYDIVVLDPPAFAKNLKAKHNAVQAYKRLNAMGLKQLNPNGLLFTFSCSQVVDATLFEHTVIAAAIESGKNIRILKRLGQAPDHPVNAFHPEGSYLKGLLIYAE